MFKANVADNRALHIVFVDDIKCNGTETHMAIVGEMPAHSSIRAYCMMDTCSGVITSGII